MEKDAIYHDTIHDTYITLDSVRFEDFKPTLYGLRIFDPSNGRASFSIWQSDAFESNRTRIYSR